ncbi:MAG: PilZ domain-containing protein [Actinobacteria bacterium]|nr:PilZ domain-containing protein [Actinomycetota bacterium]
MTAALAAGAELTLIGATRLGARRYRAVVTDILHDHIVLDTVVDQVPADNDSLWGSAASFLHDGRVFDVSVMAGGGSRLTVSKPDGLDTDDRRSGRRVVTSLPATARKANLGGAVQAAYVVDLSLGGVRLLLEMDDDTFGIDHEVDLVMGHINVRAWVRHIAAHDNPRLRYVGLEFAPLSADARRHLIDTIGSLRAGMHRWR